MKTIQREQVVTEIKRVIKWAIEEKKQAETLTFPEFKTNRMAAFRAYRLCAWNFGRLLK